MHIFHFSALLPFAFGKNETFVSSNASMVSSFHPLFHLQPTSNSSNIQQLRSNQFCMLQKGARLEETCVALLMRFADSFLLLPRFNFLWHSVESYVVKSNGFTSFSFSDLFMRVHQFNGCRQRRLFYEGANSIPSSIFIVTLEFDSIFKVLNFFKW